jgi:hypothetical protein
MMTKHEKKQRENARRRAADAAGTQLAASATWRLGGHVDLDLAALFACAKGPQKWVVVSLEAGVARVTLPRAFLRRIARTLKHRSGLRLYYAPSKRGARLCVRFTSGSGVLDGGGLDLTDQHPVGAFEPGEAVSCIIPAPAMLRAS